MLIVLHPTYTMRVTLKDRARSQFDGITVAGGTVPLSLHRFTENNGDPNCTKALAAIRDALSKAGIDAEVAFEKFDHQGG